MLVKNWMSRNVITVDINDTLSTAATRQNQFGIRGLPVLNENKLVGMVTSGDIKRASASNATSLEVHELLFLIEKITVNEIMTTIPVTVSPFMTIVEVAQILLKNKINSVPVLDEEDRLVGIITESDIFKVLISLSGSENREIDFGFQIQDYPGSIKEVTDIIRSHNGRIASILISYENAPAGFRNVCLSVYQIERGGLNDLKKALFEETKVLYMLDHLENNREIY
jgi:acetoin utilization protein AcuB